MEINTSSVPITSHPHYNTTFSERILFDDLLYASVYILRQFGLLTNMLQYILETDFTHRQNRVAARLSFKEGQVSTVSIVPIPNLY